MCAPPLRGPAGHAPGPAARWPRAARVQVMAMHRWTLAGLGAVPVAGMALILSVASGGVPHQTDSSVTAEAGGLRGVSAVAASDAWAVGFHPTTTDGDETLVLHWDGTSWQQVPSPSSGTRGSILNGVSAQSPSQAWAVGDFLTSTGAQGLVLRWDGSAWTIMVSPHPGVADALTGVSVLSSSDAWAVGDDAPRAAGTTQTLVLHWDGTSWTQVASPNPVAASSSVLAAVSVVSASDAWAVGSYQTAAGGTKTLVLHWDGTSWQLVPSPAPGLRSGLAGVSAVSGSDAWAVGTYVSRTDVAKTLVLHWNGTSWQRVASPNPLTAISSSLGGVSARSATDAWAVGQSATSSGDPRSLVLHWTGTSWRQVASPSPGFRAALTAVSARSAADAWAAGNFSVNGGPSPGDKTLLLHWNGTSWRQS